MKQFLTFVFCFFLGISVMTFYKKYSLQQAIAPLKTPISHSIPFSLAVPPKASQKGSIDAMTGQILWQAREATMPATLQQKHPVLQEEEYWTQEHSSLFITFPNTLSMDILSNTHIHIVQTLPSNFVLTQDSGVVQYKKIGNTPIGIRARHLLLTQKSGDVTVSIDPEQPLITLTVDTGSLTVAFNDTDNISKVVSIEKGQTYTFDDEQRQGDITATAE